MQSSSPLFPEAINNFRDADAEDINKYLSARFIPLYHIEHHFKSINEGLDFLKNDLDEKKKESEAKLKLLEDSEDKEQINTEKKNLEEIEAKLKILAHDAEELEEIEEFFARPKNKSQISFFQNKDSTRNLTERHLELVFSTKDIFHHIMSFLSWNERFPLQAITKEFQKLIDEMPIDSNRIEVNKFLADTRFTFHSDDNIAITKYLNYKEIKGLFEKMKADKKNMQKFNNDYAQHIRNEDNIGKILGDYKFIAAILCMLQGFFIYLPAKKMIEVLLPEDVDLHIYAQAGALFSLCWVSSFGAVGVGYLFYTNLLSSFSQYYLNYIENSAKTYANNIFGIFSTKNITDANNTDRVEELNSDDDSQLIIRNGFVK